METPDLRSSAESWKNYVEDLMENNDEFVEFMIEHKLPSGTKEECITAVTLFEHKDDLVVEHEPPANSFDLNSLGLLMRGMNGQNVHLLRILLAGTGGWPLPKSYKFDGDTEIAVMEFQEQNMIPITGSVDARTWKKLLEKYV